MPRRATGSLRRIRRCCNPQRHCVALREAGRASRRLRGPRLRVHRARRATRCGDRRERRRCYRGVVRRLVSRRAAQARAAHGRIAGQRARSRSSSTSSRAATTCCASNRRSAPRLTSTSRSRRARCSRSPSTASAAAPFGAAFGAERDGGRRAHRGVDIFARARHAGPRGDRRLGDARRDDARRRQRRLDAAVVRQHARLLRAPATSNGSSPATSS